MRVDLIETGQAIATIRGPWTDSVHLNAAAYSAIAMAVAADINVH
jgi:lysophospholipase L1-like esterase